MTNTSMTCTTMCTSQNLSVQHTLLLVHQQNERVIRLSHFVLYRQRGSQNPFSRKRDKGRILRFPKGMTAHLSPSSKI